VFNIVPNDVQGLAEMFRDQVIGTLPHVPLTAYQWRHCLPTNFRFTQLKVYALDAFGEWINNEAWTLSLDIQGTENYATETADHRQHVTYVARFDPFSGTFLSAPSKGRLYIGPLYEGHITPNGNVAQTYVGQYVSLGETFAQNLERLLPTPMLLYPVRVRRGLLGFGFRDVKSFQLQTQVGFLRSRRVQ
jgi:hypothetical protein